MGYMGFGMRKEVYKRKPKKIFDRIKKSKKPTYGRGLEPNFEASKAFHRLRFRQQHERRWFKITGRVTFTLALLFVIYVTWVEPWFYSRAKAKFQSSGIIEKFENSRSDLMTIRDFFQDRKGHLAEIEKTYYHGGIHIEIHSKKYQPPGNYYNQTASSFYHLTLSTDYEIVAEELSINKDSVFRHYGDDWNIRLLINNIKEVDSSILAFLETSATEFDKLLRIISTNNWVVSNEGFGQKIHMNHYYGTYDIIFADSLPDEEEAPSGLITEGVYWKELIYRRY